jgi:hypothetical protein
MKGISRFWALFLPPAAAGLSLLWLGLAGPERLWAGDAAAYLEEARCLLRGEGLSYYWPPALPAYLALCLAAAGMAGVAAGMALWRWLLGGLWLRATQGLAPRRRLGLLLLLTVYPAFVHQGAAPLSQLPVAAGLLLLCVLLERPQPAGALAGGFLTGGMALFRPASLLVALAGLALPRQRLRFAGLLLAAAVSLPLLWSAWASTQAGRPIRVNEASSYNFFIGNNPWTPAYATWWLGSHEARGKSELKGYYALLDSVRGLPAGQQDAAWAALAWGHIWQEPGLFLRRCLSRFLTFWSFDSFSGATVYPHHRGAGLLILLADACCFLLLAAGGLAGCTSNLAGNRVPLILVSLYMIPYLLAFSHPSYHLPVMPLLALMAARADRAAFGQRRFRWVMAAGQGLLLAIQLRWGLYWLAESGAV